MGLDKGLSREGTISKVGMCMTNSYKTSTAEGVGIRCGCGGTWGVDDLLTT